MVKHQDETLDRTFAALSDPTRRALLARLDGEASLSVSELAQPFAMSLPAIMKHLDVLSDAGLIVREDRPHGGLPAHRPADGGGDGTGSIATQRFWSENLDRLAAFVEEDPWPPSAAAQNLAERPSRPSRAGSARGRKKSTPRGPTR